MSTAFFERKRATDSQWHSLSASVLGTTLSLRSPLPRTVALVTRFTDAWTTLESTLEAVPISALLCSNDQWGQTVCPDVADTLRETWQQAALVASHINLKGVTTHAKASPPTVHPSAVTLLFNLYYTHREIAHALAALDGRLLQPTRVSAYSIRAQLESLIQYYYRSTEALRHFRTTLPCHNNPKCYPWRCDRVW